MTTRPAPKRRPTILVVDDETDVLEIETLLLAELGYDVIPCNSASEALAIIAAGDPIDMVLTDLVMLGDMDGWRLSEKIHEVCPRMKVAFTSGYVKPAAAAKIASRDHPLLSKPWRADEVALFMRQALAG
jgi:DNA-binding NtrC family response regulator